MQSSGNKAVSFQVSVASPYITTKYQDLFLIYPTKRSKNFYSFNKTVKLFATMTTSFVKQETFKNMWHAT